MPPATDQAPSPPTLHVFTMANQRHGGLLSACTLMSRLRAHFHVVAQPLFGPLPDENRHALEAVADRVGDSGEIPRLDGGDHALLYMSDYPTIFCNHAARWRHALAGTASVQIVFNRTLGSLPRERWLEDVVTRLYFHDSWMRQSWRILSRDTPLADLPAEVLAPPVELAGFRKLAARRPRPPPLIVGRLAGDADVPHNAPELYRRLAAELPEAQFWFMPSPPGLEAELGGHSQFRFYRRNAVAVPEFLHACHIYALSYWRGVRVPGPRSLMEAMAAGCAPVVIDREGPRDRVVHGESGFRSNDDTQFINYIVRLARNAPLRDRVSAAARERSRQWGPGQWVQRIVANSLGGPEDAAPAAKHLGR